MYWLLMNEGDIWSVDWSLRVGSCMWIFIILSVMSINFYRAAAMQPRFCISISICRSVRPLIYIRVCQTRALRQNNSNFWQYCYTTSHSFMTRRMICGGCPRLPLVAPHGAQKRKMAIFRRTWIEGSLLQNFFMWKLSAARLSSIHYSLSKMFGVGRPLLPEISAYPLQKRRISVDFCS